MDDHNFHFEPVRNTHYHDSEDHQYFKNSREEMLTFLPPTIRTVLDVGCGSGVFGSLVKNKFGAEVWGVELTDAGLAAKQNLHKVMLGPIQNHLNTLPNQYFDCICLNDVIEHLIDPWAVLQQLGAKLTANGVIVASIPNIRHYKSLWQLIAHGKWTYSDSGVLDRTHLRFFTALSIRQLFNDCGYRIVTMQGLRGTKKFKVKLWRYVSFGKLWDIVYPQFAVVASPSVT